MQPSFSISSSDLIFHLSKSAANLPPDSDSFPVFSAPGCWTPALAASSKISLERSVRWSILLFLPKQINVPSFLPDYSTLPSCSSISILIPSQPVLNLYLPTVSFLCLISAFFLQPQILWISLCLFLLQSLHTWVTFLLYCYCSGSSQSTGCEENSMPPQLICSL